MEVYKHKRRCGDRPDGWKIRSINPFDRVSCYIQKTRGNATNYMRDEVEISALERYIHEKRDAGLDGFGIMHCIIAAYVRAISQFPAINRFINGHKLYARNDIEIMLIVKREMKLDAEETLLKVYPNPADTAEQVYRMMEREIKAVREEDNGFDDTAKILSKIPGFLLGWAISLLNALDYFGWMPRALTKISPFHGSMFVTNLGSLGIPPIYHHLYDFGNVPVFIAFGAKNKKLEMRRDGSIVERKYLDFTFSLDERVCDGFYYSRARKYIKAILRDPWQMDVPPEQVITDVD